MRHMSRCHVLARGFDVRRRIVEKYVCPKRVQERAFVAPPETALRRADIFVALTAEGKVAHWAVSNHTTNQFALLHQHHPLVTNQLELSPLQMSTLDDGTLDQVQQLGLRSIIWLPLAGGRLFTGDDAQAQRARAEMSGLLRAVVCR